MVRYRRDDVIEHLLLDSRRLVFPASSLFFALPGPRRHGRAYVEELYRRGVRNFVLEMEGGEEWEGGEEREGGEMQRGKEMRGGEKVRRGTEMRGGEKSGGGKESQGRDMAGGSSSDGVLDAIPEANVIAVRDTLAALQTLTAWHREQFTMPVIAITGSNGKTIVKEWLNEMLEADFSIVRSPKSYNSQTGVPLSVWALAAGHDLAILEAGISRRGEMKKLAAMIRPTIGIFTNIGEAHSEGFGSLAEKAAEKLKLFDEAEILIYCSDQPDTRAAIKGARAGRTFDWGERAGAQLRVMRRERIEGWTRMKLVNGGAGGTWAAGPRAAAAAGAAGEARASGGGSGGGTGGGFEIAIPFTDDASIENAMHCVATCLVMGIAPEAIAARAARLAPIAMRLELKAGINHCSIINDSYSADLSSLAIALDFLSQQQQHPKRTVILSDILESGRPEGELYAEVGRALQQRHVDRLIGIGDRIRAHAGRIADWFDGEQVYYPTLGAFRDEVHRLHFRDETILLKGARIFEFEEIDRLLTEQIHQTVMEIDLAAMAGNLRAYRQLLRPATRVMAMVKAFAYGSGSYEIANLLQFHGVDYLGVAYADEGVALRKGGIRLPVMVMNTENSGFDPLAQYNLEPVLYSLPLLRSFERWLKREGLVDFPVHLEMETGLNRLGFAAEDWEELLRILAVAPVKVMSVFSHFAASEDAEQDAYSRRQAASYFRQAGQLEQVLGYSFIKHLSNSAAIVRLPDYQLDMVRLGIGLYGIDSSGVPDPRVAPALQEVSTLKTTIAQIKNLHEGDTIGYNRRGMAAGGTVIATVRIGYADGYSRSLGNGAGKMWVKGGLAPTIGSISMDLTMIDITGIPDVREGDEVVVFGRELPVRQLAKWAGTIPYEILTGVSQRVKRIYFE